MMAYIGIDPGKKGGACLIAPDTIEFVMWGDGDEDRILDTLREWKLEHKVDLACIEKVGAMPGQGVTSMFNFGDNNGWWRGALKGLGIGVLRITPQKWQKAMLDDRPGDSKQRSVGLCNDLTDLGLKFTKNGIDNGKADAYHLARYAKRTHRESV
jgi:crossover junction endodeoxyribonuclease RuvC